MTSSSRAAIARGLPILALALLEASCGGKKGALTLDVVVSPADDPFLDATEVAITVDGTVTKTASVLGGRFDLSFETNPTKTASPVLLEARNAAGEVVGYGRTPPVALQTYGQEIGIWVGRPGRVQGAAAALPAGRAEVTAIGVTGLGVLFVGGREADGEATSKTALYNIFSHGVIETSPMTRPRAGAVGLGLSRAQAVVFGGSDASGFGSPLGAMAAAEVFDPSVSLGLWSPQATDDSLARAYAPLAVLSGGSALVSGGLDASGAVLGTALLLTPGSSLSATPVAGAMVSPRYGHVVVGAQFPEGEGAFVFGGLPQGSASSVAEKLVGQAFTPIPLDPAVINRSFATATALPTGEILVLGGRTDSGPVASGLVFTPVTGAVRELPTALSTPRERHTATLLGSELIVCGGLDAAGAPIASCDVLDTAGLGIARTIPLGAARFDHSATVLETGVLVIAGGVGAGGLLLQSIELYTPPLG